MVVVGFPSKGLSAYCACKNLVSCAAADVIRGGSGDRKWGWPAPGQDKMTGFTFHKTCWCSRRNRAGKENNRKISQGVTEIGLRKTT